MAGRAARAQCVLASPGYEMFLVTINSSAREELPLGFSCSAGCGAEAELADQ